MQMYLYHVMELLLFQLLQYNLLVLCYNFICNLFTRSNTIFISNCVKHFFFTALPSCFTFAHLLTCSSFSVTFWKSIFFYFQFLHILLLLLHVVFLLLHLIADQFLIMIFLIYLDLMLVIHLTLNHVLLQLILIHHLVVLIYFFF